MVGFAPVFVCLIGLSVLAAGLYYASYVVRSQWLGRTFWRGCTGGESVALTFDDGPSADTERLLDVLSELGVKAAFFLVGKQVEKFPHVARRIASEGHEIGNHTYSHKNLLFCTPGAVEMEMIKAQEIITRTTNVAPTIARPPCGVRTRSYFKVAQKLGLKTIQWTTAGFDWKKLTAKQIAETVLRDTGAGSIILLHDGDSDGRRDRKATVEAIPLIVAGLRTKGLKVVSLQELLSM